MPIERFMNDSISQDLSSSAFKRFMYVVAAFLFNALFAAITILTKGDVDPMVTKVLAAIWILATVSYAIAAGAYFTIWGKYRWLWGVVILFLQPVSLTVTFPYILYKSFKHGWHKSA